MLALQMNFSTETSNRSASRFATDLLMGRCPFSMFETFWRVNAPSPVPSSFRDAFVVVGAQSANCEQLYSEDLQDGQKIGGLRVRNRFS
jgi:hypothetical protein